MPLPSPERLSDLIGSIYDCVIAREHWPATLTSVFTEIGCSNAALSVHDARTLEMKLHVIVGLDQEWIEQSPKYGPEVIEIWGGPQRASNTPLEEPVVQSQVTPRSTWLSNRWYREMLLPRHLHDCIAVVLARDSQTFGVIAFGVHEDKGEISDDTLAGVRLIAPHLRRAVTISRLFEQQAMATATFSDVLERIAAGAVLVDESLGIVHANAAARTMLANSDPIQSRAGKLSLSRPMSNSVLASAVSAAAQNEAAMERRSIDFPVGRADGTPTVIQVLPLRRRMIGKGLEQRTVAAIFISNAADPPRLPGDALAMLYDLTPAETRIFEFIVEGATPAEISGQLGLSLATVRTHLSRVFEKTGCARQADLVALAGKVTLTV